ncbi:hypothetical protein [Methyloceanibacter caenitepidi]|uniref:Uncharacterized protein n=1 Tax=Methyloceanibacter caenitepidi TaxID=1384459 RepID=A0A0A8K5T0_9HYPH|nr:hypothetical protein [Methyloceanibacter caenitepidi]BAQ18303.1 hypothetical protein GL4_2870 [Methyloceanibacter caenitepidi]
MRFAIAIGLLVVTTPASADECADKYKTAANVVTEHASAAHLCRDTFGSSGLLTVRTEIESLLMAAGTPVDEATVGADQILKQAEAESARQDLGGIPAAAKERACLTLDLDLQTKFKVALAAYRVCLKSRAKPAPAQP